MINIDLRNVHVAAPSAINAIVALISLVINGYYAFMILRIQ